jgi:nicotinamidase-related amidase
MSDALLVIDMLNPYDHEDAEVLKASATSVVPVIVDLVRRARERDTLVVYVNDCWEDWTADRHAIGDNALKGTAPELVEPLIPSDDVPFIVKARHSVFYGTSLEYLLRTYGIERIILTGQVTEQCILYSALDAYVRRFAVTTVRDGVAHIHQSLADAALQMMERNMGAYLVSGSDVLCQSQPAH